MTQNILTKASFHVIGIKRKTSNQSAMHDISQIWNEFFSENIKNKISNKITEDIFAIYSEYKGNYTKPYSYILGCSVSSFNAVPEEMIGITMPSAQYEIFTAKGKRPDNLIKTWQYI